MLGISDLTEQIKNRAHILKISGSLSFGVHAIVVTVFGLFFIPSFFLLCTEGTKMLGNGKKSYENKHGC